MSKSILLVFVLFLFACAEKQHTATNDVSIIEETVSKDLSEKEIKNPSYFFPKKKTKILLVGSFHFDYPGMDEHKTGEDDKVDVLKEPKKTEITELVAYIKKFKPTKIAIEAGQAWNATQKLRDYKAGGLRDDRDERVQLGMRLATDLYLDTLYAVNSYSIKRDLYKTDTLTLHKMIGKVDWEREDVYWDYVENWFAYDDKLVSQTNLIDYFKYMNSRESHQYGYGIYLLGNFKTENNQGADHLSIWWYNRNLRIFRNIQGITEGVEDRILVIMGNGHAAILRQLFEASPEYEFVEFDSL